MARSSAPWKAIAPCSEAPDHVVYFYEEGAFPDASVADFLWAGIEANEGVLVLATPEHTDTLKTRLGARGVDVDALVQSGLLALRDAQEVVDAIQGERLPDATRFDAIVGSLVDSLAERSESGRTRIYGECVALLADEKNVEGSIALELLWNQLQASRAFSLCCGYPIHHFSHQSLAEAFLQVCDAHDHVVPAPVGPGSDGHHGRCIAILQQQARAMRGEIAERARTEALLTEAMRALTVADRRKDDFLAMLGHELRNPLAPVAIAVEVLERQGDPRGTRARGVIRRQVDHLTRLVDDLLEVSRITHGKIELRRQMVEIGGVLDAVVELVRPLVDARKHDLQVKAPTRGLAVWGDAIRLRQILSNIVVNATKFTSPGGRIQVDARRVGDAITIDVADTGCGIPEDLLSAIFEPFVQGARGLDRAQGGLGLGLAMARELARLHGGTVSAKSPGPGRGTTFTVVLPAATARVNGGASAAFDATGAKGGDAARRSARVLVVDDNRDSADMLSDALTDAGFEVVTAYDADQALDLAAEAPPDIALLDVGLPGMSGYELGVELRKRLPQLPLRLVAMTGYGHESDRARSRESGFDLHLVKPVTLDVVLKAVEGQSP